MSSLTTDRIRETATKLGLTHLTEVITDPVDRAETAQVGYPDFVDTSSRKSSAYAKDDASATH